MDVSSARTDIVLIAGCLDGDRKSQKDLYTILSPKMYALCIKYVSNRADAEDILQESFIKLFSNLHKFRGEGSFEGWVRKIFVHTAIEQYRRKKPSFQNEDEYTNLLPCAERSALDNLYEKDILNLMKQMSEGYRLTFYLYAVQGYSHKEIASLMGITESTSKSQYSRAKSCIRNVISRQNN